MGLLSFLKRTPPGRAPAAVSSDAADPVQQARTRARQRLVGSVVLVAVGVIGFPLLFETQPRQLPIDTPIEVVRKDASTAKPQVKPPAKPALAPPAPAPAVPNVITERADEAGKEIVAAASAPFMASQPASAAKPAAAAKPAMVAAASKPAPKPEAKPESKPKPTAPKPVTDSSRAQAALEDKKPAAAEGGRFVVQIGAFSEVSAARDARQRADKLGLGVRIYTQAVDTSSGQRTRVRAGPFPSRDEAEKIAAKVKAGGMTAQVFAL